LLQREQPASGVNQLAALQQKTCRDTLPLHARLLLQARLLCLVGAVALIACQLVQHYVGHCCPSCVGSHASRGPSLRDCAGYSLYCSLTARGSWRHATNIVSGTARRAIPNSLSTRCHVVVAQSHFQQFTYHRVSYYASSTSSDYHIEWHSIHNINFLVSCELLPAWQYTVYYTDMMIMFNTCVLPPWSRGLYMCATLCAYHLCMTLARPSTAQMPYRQPAM
jgi:hypothetical protein